MKQRLKRKITKENKHELRINGKEPDVLGRKVKLSHDIIKQFKKGTLDVESIKRKANK